MSPFGFSSTVDEVAQAFADQTKGRTFLITGPSTNSLAAAAAIAMSRYHPAHFILVGRTKAKIDSVAQEIAANSGGATKTTFVQCDLSDFDSVRRAAAEINADPQVPAIDFMLNSAGVMGIKDYTTDKQGNELQFSSNHLGHFLLTNLVLPKVLAAGGKARIVNVTSEGHRISPMRLSDPTFSSGAAYDRWSAYGQSKSANILFTVALASRLASLSRSVTALSVHPGAVPSTNIGTHVEPSDFDDINAIARANYGRDTFNMGEFKNTEQGAAPLVAAALDPAFEASSGAFIEDCQVSEALAEAVDPETARKLWALSEELVGEKFDV